jgi:hypothetical protein
MGFYTEAFKKGAPYRASVNFIYRVMDYYVAADSIANTKTGHLVLGGGVTVEPTNDLSLFLKGEGALYSFSLKNQLNGLEKFLFDARLGVTYRFKTLQSKP